MRLNFRHSSLQSRSVLRPLASVLLAGTVGILASTATSASAATHPAIPVLDAKTINDRCDSYLANFRRQKGEMEAKSSSAGIFAEWNRLSMSVEDVAGPLAILANVLTDQAGRDAADACTLKFTPFTTDLFQSETLYKRVLNAKPANAREAKYKSDLLESFEDTGVTLPPEKRARAKEINEKIDALGQQFEKNIRDDGTKLTFKPEEMAGMPDNYLAAQKKDDQGNYVLPLSYPSYIPFLQSATNEDARKRYWTAKQNEGGSANLDLLDQVVKLRLELANLYGWPDYATYVLRRRMAENPDAVYKFLGDVKQAVTGLEKKELEELRTLKAETSGQPLDSTRLNRWDLAFYQEKLKKTRYSVDQEALRKYFPAEASIAYTLKIAETLYSIRFVPRKVATWHPEVRYYDVFEAGKNGKPGDFIGGVYLDMFPRDGKYNHAAAWPVRGVSTLAHRTPISVLVTNFDRKGLNQEELATLLHEFGHVMHGVLSKTVYVDEAGTSVRHDFVEAPSQMFEEWARREESLKLFNEVCKDCPHLTTEQIAQLEAAHKFGQGIQYARQWLYSAFDMALTTPKPDGALATWDKMEGQTYLGHVEGTMFPAGFGHLMSGYAAGYYGYMWSEVLELDMLSKFKGHMLDPQVGHSYREHILSMGGQEPPQQLVESFLGRKSNSDAFYQEITGQR